MKGSFYGVWVGQNFFPAPMGEGSFQFEDPEVFFGTQKRQQWRRRRRFRKLFRNIHNRLKQIQTIYYPGGGENSSRLDVIDGVVRGAFDKKKTNTTIKSSEFMDQLNYQNWN